jgi:poly-gamma-glutamate synthesis protein (capsule biosynthesis protein)
MLERAGLAYAGAGRNAVAAASPATLDVAGKGRVLVFGLGSVCSGIPLDWGAIESRPGIHLLEDLSEETARRVADRIRQVKRPGDVAVASIHWGSNWGYEIPHEQIHFAHWLIQGGVDVVHGHSSHHVRAIEVYRDRPILYGCGDFLTDYEGIAGYEVSGGFGGCPPKFPIRGDLALMYLAKLDPQEGRLLQMRLVPMQPRRFRLNRTSEVDVKWLCDLLNGLGAPFETRVQLEGENSLSLRW